MLKPRIRIVPAVTIVLAVALAGSADASTPLAKAKANPAVEISTAKVGKLGPVLVDGEGHVLYVFAPDKHSKVACNSDCQSIWPPLVAPKTGVAKAAGSAKQSLIGSDKNPADGKRIVTYNGWPLYTYVSDQAPGQADGQDLDLNGGYWWVMRPDGQIEK